MRFRKIILLVLSTVVLVGILTYLRLAFEQADVKTAVRLVEQAQIKGVPIGKKLHKWIPKSHRLCKTKTLSQFYGHMEVMCQDTRDLTHVFLWRVNVIDGMVKPANTSAKRLETGEPPWETEK